MTEQQRIDIVSYRIGNAVNSLYPETCRFVIFIKGLVDNWLTK